MIISSYSGCEKLLHGPNSVDRFKYNRHVSFDIELFKLKRWRCEWLLDWSNPSNNQTEHCTGPTIRAQQFGWNPPHPFRRSNLDGTSRSSCFHPTTIRSTVHSYSSGHGLTFTCLAYMVRSIPTPQKSFYRIPSLSRDPLGWWPPAKSLTWRELI